MLHFRKFFPKFQKFAVPKKTHIFAQLFAQIFGLKIFEQIFAKLFAKIFGCEKNCENFFANICANFWVKKNLCKFLRNYLQKNLGLKIFAQIFLQIFVQIFGKKIFAQIFADKFAKKLAQIFYGSYLGSGDVSNVVDCSTRTEMTWKNPFFFCQQLNFSERVTNSSVVGEIVNCWSSEEGIGRGNKEVEMFCGLSGWLRGKPREDMKTIKNGRGKKFEI